MDTGAIRPLPSYTAFVVPRVSETNTATARTDLPEEATVRQTPTSAESRSAEHRFEQSSQRRRDTERANDLDRRVERDPSTDSFVYKAIDTESGEIVSQVPNDSLLKLRAYVETMTQSAARRDQAQTVNTQHAEFDRTA